MIIHVEDDGTAGYWTVLDVTSGLDMRSVHQFADRLEAEEMADVMNGKLANDSE